MQKLDHNTPLTQWLSLLEISHDKSIDMGLERISIDAQLLKLNRIAPFVITVSGTNGKGSSCRLLEQIFLKSGYRVGLFSSPHLLVFNERVRINGENAKDSDFTTAFSEIFYQKTQSLSFFEMVTLAAFRIFQQHHLDIVILEVGLGGRYDATNSIDANAALITSIDYDHTHFLGTDLEKIGYEKAGIMREQIPVVLGQSTIESLVSEATRLNCRYLVAGVDFSYQIDEQYFYFHHNGRTITTSLPYLPAPNVANVIALLSLLPFQLDERVIVECIENTTMMGRFEQIEGSKVTPYCNNFTGRVIIDVGHNGHAARFLAQRLIALKKHDENISIQAVFSCLKDKDFTAIITPLIEIIDQWHLAPLGGSRGQSIEEITEKMQAVNYQQKNTASYPKLADAFISALQNATRPQDIVLVFGSFHTCEAIYKMLEKQ